MMNTMKKWALLMILICMVRKMRNHKCPSTSMITLSLMSMMSLMGAVLVLLAPPLVSGHAMLVQPRPRNSIEGTHCCKVAQRVQVESTVCGRV